MRALRFGILGLGALLVGGAVMIGCSSDNGETPFDAGELPDGLSGSEDGSPSNPDTGSLSPGNDAGDATLSNVGQDSGGPVEDAADSSLHAGEDAAGHDAGEDASLADGSKTNDASESSPADAAEASTLCNGFSVSQDAITSMSATTSPGGATLNITTTDPTQNPVPADDSVVLTVTTSPVGVMEDIYVAYVAGSATTPVYVPMTLVSTTGANQQWSGTIPPIAAGEQVTFWVVGHDYCKTEADAGADYYSNSGANYHYETQASGDASVADASDASQGEDASDDASLADGGDAASTDAGEDALADATDDSPFDAASLCSGFNLAGDAINGIAAVTSPGAVTLNIVTTDPTQNPVPQADSVVVTATTSPIGVMEDISIGYVIGGSATPLYVPMSLVVTSGGTNQEWTGSIPPIASGNDVSFWVVGHDYCKTDADAGADYYSNGGANYHYETTP